MLQGTEHLCNPVTPRPQPQPARGLERRGETEQVKPILTGLVDDAHGDRAIGRTLGPQTGRATVRCVEALTKGPIVLLMPQISTLYLAAILKVKGRGGFALDQEGTLMGVSHMGHQLRVTEPAIGHHQRGWQVEAASAQGRQALIKHDLRPAELGAATPPWSCGIGPTHGKVDGHHQLAVANDHQQQHAINAIHHALVRPTPPRADQLQLATLFSKDRVIQHPRPLPATAGGVTHRLDVAPKRTEDILTELAEPLEPGTFGQGAQDARGQVLVPSARAGQLIGIAAAEERGEHEGKDFPEELLLGSQTAFDLDNEIIGQTEIIESLAQRFDIALGLFLLVFMALLGVEATPFDRVGLLFDVSSGAGHGDVLRLRDDRYEGRRTPCPMWARNGNEILRAPTYRYK